MTDTKQNLEQRVNDLLQLRATITRMEEEKENLLAPLKALRDKNQSEIMQEMKESGQFSARFQRATVSRAVRKSLQVIDQSEVLKDLKEKGLDKEYSSLQLNDLFFGEYSKQLIKSGELLKGTAISEKEYISIKKVETEERRKIAGEFIK